MLPVRPIKVCAAGTSRTVTVTANTLTVGGGISNGTTANSITKAGLGTLTLGGANSYTGNTFINEGTVQLSGTADGSKPALALDFKGAAESIFIGEMLRQASGSNQFGSAITVTIDGRLNATAISVRGSGTVAKLDTSTMDYEARITLGREGPEIPLRCRGKIAGTSCLPDFKAISQRRLANPLGNALRKLKEEVKGKPVEPVRKAQ